MWVLFAALSAALLLTCIWQRIQYRKLQKKSTISVTDWKRFLLLLKMALFFSLPIMPA